MPPKAMRAMKAMKAMKKRMRTRQSGKIAEALKKKRAAGLKKMKTEDGKQMLLAKDYIKCKQKENETWSVYNAEKLKVHAAWELMSPEMQKKVEKNKEWWKQE